MTYGADKNSPYKPNAAVQHGLKQPFMLMLSGKHGFTAPSDGYEQSWADFCRTLRGYKRALRIPTGTLGTYMDVQFLAPQLFKAKLMPASGVLFFTGSINPTRAHLTQMTYVDSFFARFLSGRDNHLLDKPAAGFPEMEFVGQPQTETPTDFTALDKPTAPKPIR